MPKIIYVTPVCCEQVQKTKAVTLLDMGYHPQWVTSCPVEHSESHDVAPVSFCPHCSNKLPTEFAIDHSVSPICEYDDGYCKTCGERASRYGNCQCLPSEFKYKAV